MLWRENDGDSKGSIVAGPPPRGSLFCAAGFSNFVRPTSLTLFYEAKPVFASEFHAWQYPIKILSSSPYDASSATYSPSTSLAESGL